MESDEEEDFGNNADSDAEEYEEIVRSSIYDWPLLVSHLERKSTKQI